MTDLNNIQLAKDDTELLQATNNVILYLKKDAAIRKWFRTVILVCALLSFANLVLFISFFSYMKSVSESLILIERRTAHIEYSLLISEKQYGKTRNCTVD